MKKLKEINLFLENDSLLIAEEKRKQQENERSALLRSLNPIEEELNRDNYLGSYSTFEGSPFSEGLFQFDMWTKDGSRVDHKAEGFCGIGIPLEIRF